MVIEAGRLGCTREVLVIVAALSIQDPRERPVDKEAQADQSHARFKDERSDFATLPQPLALPQGAAEGAVAQRLPPDVQGASTSTTCASASGRTCTRSCARPAARCASTPTSRPPPRDAEPDWDTIHKALLAGLLSHVGARDQAKREYAGARGARFGISPGSALFRKQPDLVMAAELVETSRLWARVNAAIEPEWAEEVGAHVVARTVSEPRWSRKAGAAVATERVTLYGVPLVTDRTIQYARIDPEAAREIFIRSALVEGDWAAAARLLDATTSPRSRGSPSSRSGPGGATSSSTTRCSSRSTTPASRPTCRPSGTSTGGGAASGAGAPTCSPSPRTTAHLARPASRSSAADYPRTWRQGDLDLDVTYQFSPGRGGRRRHRARAGRRAQPGDLRGLRLAGARAARRPRDRPAQVAAQGDPPPLRADPRPRAWPRSPRPTRRAARSLEELARVLHERTGIRIPPGEWDLSRVPDHLRVTFSVDGPGGRVVARGKDLEALRDRRPAARCGPGWRAPGPRWSAPA